MEERVEIAFDKVTFIAESGNYPQFNLLGCIGLPIGTIEEPGTGKIMKALSTEWCNVKMKVYAIIFDKETKKGTITITAPVKCPTCGRAY